jgi:hypothetical protein
LPSKNSISKSKIESAFSKNELTEIIRERGIWYAIGEAIFYRVLGGLKTAGPGVRSCGQRSLTFGYKLRKQKGRIINHINSIAPLELIDRKNSINLSESNIQNLSRLRWCPVRQPHGDRNAIRSER